MEYQLNCSSIVIILPRICSCGIRWIIVGDWIVAIELLALIIGIRWIGVVILLDCRVDSNIWLGIPWLLVWISIKLGVHWLIWIVSVVIRWLIWIIIWWISGWTIAIGACTWRSIQVWGWLAILVGIYITLICVMSLGSTLVIPTLAESALIHKSGLACLRGVPKIQIIRHICWSSCYLTAYVFPCVDKVHSPKIICMVSKLRGNVCVLIYCHPNILNHLLFLAVQHPLIQIFEICCRHQNNLISV